jgi:rubrerythrin
VVTTEESILKPEGDFVAFIPDQKIASQTLTDKSETPNQTESQAKFCIYCGEKLNDSPKFCPNCGKMQN